MDNGWFAKPPKAPMGRKELEMLDYSQEQPLIKRTGAKVKVHPNINFDTSMKSGKTSAGRKVNEAFDVSTGRL